MKHGKLQSFLRDAVIFLTGVALATMVYMFFTVPVLFKLEVGFTDLFNFLTNVIFVFLLTQYFNKIFIDRRSLKDNIKDKCKVVLLKLEECHELFDKLFDKADPFTEKEKEDMRWLVKSFRKSTESMIEMIQDTPYTRPKSEWSLVEADRGTFWSTLTGDSLDAGKYKTAEKKIIDNMYRALRREINKIVITIDLA